MERSPLSSAKRLNQRVKQHADYYDERLRVYLQLFWQDGYAEGMDPPEDTWEEFVQITPRVPWLLQIAADEQRAVGERIRAWNEVSRWLTLRERYGAEATRTQEAAQAG